MSKLSKTLALVVIVGIAAQTATAQEEKVLLGSGCTIDDRYGLLEVHVYHRTQGARSISFAAPQPACMVGVSYLGETSPFEVTGASQSGVTIDYGSCLITGYNYEKVLTITYFASGQTPACCRYDLLPHGVIPFEGCLAYVDCEGVRKPTGPDGRFPVHVNPDESCMCVLTDDGGSPIPVNVFPPDGASEVSTNVTITWDVFEGPRYCQLLYNVWTWMFFGTDPEPPRVARFHGGAFAPGQLEPDVTYYWRVKLWLGATYTLSPVMEFTTTDEVPVARQSWGAIKALYLAESD